MLSKHTINLVVAIYFISTMLMANEPQLERLFLVGTDISLPTILGLPPDVNGAIGTKQFIVALNDGIRSFKRNGHQDNILDVPQNSFFGINSSVSQLFDPHILFDHFEKRWLILYDQRSTANIFASINNFLYLAVSDSDVITNKTKWDTYSFQHNLIPDTNGNGGDNDFVLDLPILGMDKHAYYIGENFLSDSDFSQIRRTAYVIQKKSIIKKKSPVITAFRNLNSVNRIPVGQDAIGMLQPVINYDTNPKFGYFFALEEPANEITLNNLIIWRIINACSKSPSISQKISVPLPEKVLADFTGPSASQVTIPHRGNLFGKPGELDGLLDNAGNNSQGVVHNGHLYFVTDLLVNQQGLSDPNAIPAPDRVGVRFYEWDLSGGSKERIDTTPTLVQYVTIWDNASANPQYYYNASLSVNKYGDIAIGGSVSSNNTFINTWYAVRSASDPLNTISAPIQATNNTEFSYNLAPSAIRPGQRWGDYSSVFIDPCDGKSFWMLQQGVSHFNEYALYGMKISMPTKIKKPKMKKRNNQ